MIRKAKIDDFQRVAEIYIQSRKLHIPYAKPAHTEQEIRDWIREHLIPSGHVLVLEKEGEISAMMAISHSEKSSWIDQLYVDPDLTGQGLGSVLLDFAKKELDPPIFLYTFQQNQRARRFYERNGFEAIKFTDGKENEEKCPDVLYRLCVNRGQSIISYTAFEEDGKSWFFRSRG